MSLPAPVLAEQSAFGAAMRDRYKGEIVSVRLDIKNRVMRAVRKQDRAREWTRCDEVHHLAPGILLPGYTIKQSFAPPGREAGEDSGSNDESME